MKKINKFLCVIQLKKGRGDMNWIDRFISDNNKKKEEKKIEANLNSYSDYLQSLSLEELNILYSQKKADFSIKKSIRNILAGGWLLFFMSSVFTILKKLADSYGLFITNQLDKDISSILSPVIVLIIFLLVFFFISYSLILIIYYKDTKKLDIQVSLIDIIRNQKNNKQM